MTRLIAILAAVALLASPALAKRAPTASCSVSPNPTQINHDPNASAIAFFTVTATSGDWFYVQIAEPSGGPVNLSGPYAPGATVDWTWDTPYAGVGTASVIEQAKPGKTVATCSFTVLT